MNCRYCLKPIEDEPVKTLAYWNQTPDVCHAECKREGERAAALECQIIDADCNDCKHYKRGVLAQKIESLLHKPNGRIEIVTFQPNEIIGGRCGRFNFDVMAFPHTWTGKECFEHRRL